MKGNVWLVPAATKRTAELKGKYSTRGAGGRENISGISNLDSLCLLKPQFPIYEMGRIIRSPSLFCRCLCRCLVLQNLWININFLIILLCDSDQQIPSATAVDTCTKGCALQLFGTTVFVNLNTGIIECWNNLMPIKRALVK